MSAQSLARGQGGFRRPPKVRASNDRGLILNLRALSARGADKARDCETFSEYRQQASAAENTILAGTMPLLVRGGRSGPVYEPQE